MRRNPKTCSYHCGKCHQHFNSMAAFDAHRRGKHMPKKGQRGRRCVAAEDAAAPNGTDLFVATTHKGTCKLNSHGVSRSVTIWSLREQ